MGIFRRDKGGSKGSSGGKTKSSKRRWGIILPPTDEDGPRTLVGMLLSWLPLHIRLCLLIPFYAACLAIAASGVLMIYYTMTFPDLLALQNSSRAPVIRILARDGSVLAERGNSHAFIPIKLLPPRVTNAVIATEDQRFYRHWGVDPVGLVRAALSNLRAGRYAQGGSTLTQQLAKNLFLTPERTISRKLEELALAFWLEIRFTKPQILELYLNRVYFGGGAYGIEAAAQRFFDKSARALTHAEAALIAGLLKAPSKYSPSANPGAARARGRTVLNKMYSADLITVDELRQALRQPLRFAPYDKPKNETAAGVSYAVDYVLERMPQLIEGGTSEIIVETTIDHGLQLRANDILKRSIRINRKKHNVNQAALVVLDNEGGIRALTGGLDYGRSQFNRAVAARRQPGSAFKPFVYLAALEAGASPDTVKYDLPVNVDGWTPKNGNGKFSGAVSLRQALAHSINTVAVRVGLDVGVQKVSATAHRFGITSPLRTDPSLALGTSEVSLLELTGAYAIMAAGGDRIEPHIIRRVRMSSGRVLYARAISSARRVASLNHVGELSDMLRLVVAEGTGRRAKLAGHISAGKTGTSQSARDAWFVGYTAHMTAGIWVGNDNASPMRGVSGGGLPAELWRKVMTVAHHSKAPLPLLATAELRHKKRLRKNLPPSRRTLRADETAANPIPDHAKRQRIVVKPPEAAAKKPATAAVSRGKGNDRLRKRWSHASQAPPQRTKPKRPQPNKGQANGDTAEPSAPAH